MNWASTETPFDRDRPETWKAALEGVTRAYVTYQPDIAIEGGAAAIAHLTMLAREAGLKQLVLLSGRGEPAAQRAEVQLQRSGVPWTIVRTSWFNQNFSEGHLLESVLAGEIAMPAGPVPEPFIGVDDTADVVVAALTDEPHINTLYEVTGPRALTFTDAVAEISQAVGRPLVYRQVSTDAFTESMAPHQPAEIIDFLIELWTVGTRR